jgi:hypothetical protein
MMIFPGVMWVSRSLEHCEGEAKHSGSLFRGNDVMIIKFVCPEGHGD